MNLCALCGENHFIGSLFLFDVMTNICYELNEKTKRMNRDLKLPIKPDSLELRSWRDFRDAVTRHFDILNDFYTHRDWQSALYDAKELLANYHDVSIKLCHDERGMPCDLGWDLGPEKMRAGQHLGICLPPGFRRF